MGWRPLKTELFSFCIKTRRWSRSNRPLSSSFIVMLNVCKANCNSRDAAKCSRNVISTFWRTRRRKMPVSEFANRRGALESIGRSVRRRPRSKFIEGREIGILDDQGGGKSSGNEKTSKVILFLLGDGTDEWQEQMRRRREDLVKGAATSLHLTVVILMKIHLACIRS